MVAGWAFNAERFTSGTVRVVCARYRCAINVWAFVPRWTQCAHRSARRRGGSREANDRLCRSHDAVASCWALCALDIAAIAVPSSRAFDRRLVGRLAVHTGGAFNAMQRTDVRAFCRAVLAGQARQCWLRCICTRVTSSADLAVGRVRGWCVRPWRTDDWPQRWLGTRTSPATLVAHS